MTTETARAAIDGFRARSLTSQDMTQVVRDLAAELPDEEKKALAQTLLFGLPPSRKIGDMLYLMVIGALLVILLTCAAVLTGIVSTPDPDVTMDRVLGIFTTVLSFIIGLFVPSPATRSD
ncbi:MAG: hypothetical protein ACXW27_15100 [Allosphingosinicella sp.]